MRDIPGTMGWPVIGETFSFISDFSSPAGILSFMRDRQRRFGKVFKTYVLGRITVFMTGRDAAKILLSGKDGVVSLNLFYTGKQVLGPTSLLTTNGEEHKKLRRLIGEPLSVDALKKYLGFINDLAVQTLDTWHGRSRVLVLEEASSVSISSTCSSRRRRGRGRALQILTGICLSDGSRRAVHAEGDRQHAGELGAGGRGAGEVPGKLQGDLVVVRVATAQGPRHGLPPGPQGQEPDVRDAGLGDREAAEGGR